MIDIIKTLVDALVRGLPGLMGLREDRRRRKLGAELFLLYAKINQVVLTAEGIVGFLEAYVAYVEQKPSPPSSQSIQSSFKGSPPRFDDMPVLKNAVPLLERQAEDLRKVHELLSGRSSGRLTVIMQILDPDAHNRLAVLLGGKQGALGMLIHAISSHRVPLDPFMDEIDAIARALPAPPEHPAASFMIVDHLWPHADAFRWLESALPGREHVSPAEVYAQVKRYLDERSPREQLDEMRSSLATLRSALLENFTLADVLLEVGDARLGK